MFDKSKELFPVKNSYVYLSHCGVSPLYSGALKKEQEFARMQREKGGVELVLLPNHDTAGRRYRL